MKDLEPSKMRKIIITDDLKKVLLKMNNTLSNILISGQIDEEMLANPEKNFNYFDISHTTKGHLSYLNNDRIKKIESEDMNYWDVKKRYHAKPGSIIKKLFKTNNWDVESFATQFLSIVDPPEYKMLVVKGKDIAKYYDYHTYYEQRGSLGGSCMKASPADFFDIYVENPDLISMLVMINQHDQIMGRSILWNNDNFKLMDRVYVSNDNYMNYFYEWAKENDYYYKEFNNWYSPKHWIYKDNKEIKEFEFDIKNVKFEKYPYLDSFKWLDVVNHKIYNYIPKNNNDIICISDHMGRYLSSDYFKFCDMSNGCYIQHEVHYIDYLDMNIYSGSLNWSQCLNRYIYNIHCIYKEDINDYIFIDEYDQYNDKTLIENKKKEREQSMKADTMLGIRLGNQDVNWYDQIVDEALTFESAEPIESPPLAQPLSSVELEEVGRIVNEYNTCTESQPSISRMTIPDFNWG